MKFKKCFKWTLITAAVITFGVWLLSDLGEHNERYGKGAAGHRGFENGNWLPQANLHEHMHHGGFHLVGFAITAVLWGIVLVAIIKAVRRRAAKKRNTITSSQLSAIQDLHQPATPNAQFLDQWEKNLTTLKEDSTHGNL